MKRCTRCATETDQFAKDRQKADGLTSWCKPCVSETSKAYRKANQEQYNAGSRERSKRWKAANPEKNKDIRAMVSARTRGASVVEKVELARVVERCGGICGICGEAIEGRFDLDHIIAIRDGGTHTEDNLQVAHPSCNRRKEGFRQAERNPRTHCRNGHEYTIASTGRDANGHRFCRVCSRQNVRNYHEKVRVAKREAHRAPSSD